MRRRRSRYEAKEAMTYVAMAVGFGSFVAIWMIVGEVIGNGAMPMQAIGMIGGAIAGIFITGQILVYTEEVSEPPTVVCIACRQRESVPGYELCEPCAAEIRRTSQA